MQVFQFKARDLKEGRIWSCTSFDYESINWLTSIGKWTLNRLDGPGVSFKRGCYWFHAAFGDRLEFGSYTLRKIMNTDGTPLEPAYSEFVSYMEIKRKDTPMITETPLMWAAVKGHTEVVCVLLEAGADPLAVDALGATPALLAVQYQQVPALLVLLGRGQHERQLVSTDHQGRSPAHWAAYKGQPEALHARAPASPSATRRPRSPVAVSVRPISRQRASAPGAGLGCRGEVAETVALPMPPKGVTEYLVQVVGAGVAPGGAREQAGRPWPPAAVARACRALQSAAGGEGRPPASPGGCGEPPARARARQRQLRAAGGGRRRSDGGRRPWAAAGWWLFTAAGRQWRAPGGGRAAAMPRAGPRVGPLRRAPLPVGAACVGAAALPRRRDSCAACLPSCLLPRGLLLAAAAPPVALGPEARRLCESAAAGQPLEIPRWLALADEALAKAARLPAEDVLLLLRALLRHRVEDPGLFAALGDRVTRLAPGLSVSAALDALELFGHYRDSRAGRASNRALSGEASLQRAQSSWRGRAESAALMAVHRYATWLQEAPLIVDYAALAKGCNAPRRRFVAPASLQSVEQEVKEGASIVEGMQDGSESEDEAMPTSNCPPASSSAGDDASAAPPERIPVMSWAAGLCLRLQETAVSDAARVPGGCLVGASKEVPACAGVGPNGGRRLEV
ncbi:unnamed protein product [Prorocentrum cordatum]|uniref:Uncharacterized protein n=1 Tax=Prorocentrum cordatum TaxID=2364126 RepID=A0ABN9WRG1_9DINO|nr:unnamed protein product [Polarella glacialis]